MFSKNNGYSRKFVNVIAGEANDKIDDLRYQIKGLEAKVKRLQEENERLRNQLGYKDKSSSFSCKPLGRSSKRHK